MEPSQLSIVSIRDLDELLDGPLSGRVVVDADRISAEDVGLLARRVRRDGAELVLFGEDAGRTASRRLLFDFAARWISWPPDVRTLETLIGREQDEPRTTPTETPARSPVRLSPAEAPELPVAATEEEEEFTLRPVRARATGFGLGPGELEEIEAILEGREARALPSEPSSFPTFAPLEEEEDDDEALAELDEDDDEFGDELDDDLDELWGTDGPDWDASLEDDDDDFSGAEELRGEGLELSDEELELLESELALGEGSSHALPDHRPPVWFKDQVADLADHVQRLELSLTQAQDEGIDVHGPFGEGRAIQREKLSELQDETARLGQFTRTLSFLAAPPARGEQLFDLRTLLEEQVRGQAGGEHAPRFMMRIPEILPVRSNKTLLLQAFDAFLFLARRCTDPTDTVRVEATPTQVAGAPHVQVKIHFGRGPLQDLPVEEILRPYGVRRLVPEMGANALAAASGIVEGQGGEVRLAELGLDDLEWTISLPRIDPTA